jgi:hypothetical protein
MRRLFSLCLVGLFPCLAEAPSLWAAGGADLVQQMRDTGKPALIIAGNEGCVYCRQMAQELASNQEIQPLVRQFFVVKVDTDSNDWPVLRNAFKFEESGIPAVFVVRGDGKLIYSESGKPSDVGAFLKQMLDSAGTILDAERLKSLQKAARDAQLAVKRKDFARASVIFKEQGGSGSYAAAALALQKLADDLTAQAIAAADAAESHVTGREKPVEAAIELAQLRRTFAELPAAKEHIDAVWTRLADSDAHKELMGHAVRLDEAARHVTEKKWDEALAIYREIAQASPGSAAAAFAEGEIPEIERRATIAKTGKSASSPAASESTAADPKKAAAYLKFAKVFLTKDPDKARDYLQRTIDAAPESAEAEEAQNLLDGLK